MTHILVLGGARSGKSQFAESLLEDAPAVQYVATAAQPADDPDWAERIRRHRERRPASWRTVETADLAGVLGESGPAVLIDSITAWLARAMDDAGCWAAEGCDETLTYRVDELVRQWQATSRQVIAVSDEVGLGVVPESAAGRRFRDELGTLNQLLAQAADEIHLVVAGVSLRLR